MDDTIEEKTDTEADQDEDREGSGFIAISEHVGKFYTEKPLGVINGQDEETPFACIRVQERDTPIPHWFYNTYGFTELYEKEHEDLSISGFGFELTYRLLKDKNDDGAPFWPAKILLILAESIFGSLGPVHAGQHVVTNIDFKGSSDRLHAVVFMEDPEFKTIMTPNGSVQFLQMIPIDDDEVNQLDLLDSFMVLKALEEEMPLYISALDRRSFVRNYKLLDRVKAEMREKGSTTNTLILDSLDFELKKRFWSEDVLTIKLKKNEYDEFRNLFKARLGFGKGLNLVSGSNFFVFSFTDDRPHHLDVMRLDGVDRTDKKDAIALNKACCDEIIKNLDAGNKEIVLSSWNGFIIQFG